MLSKQRAIWCSACLLVFLAGCACCGKPWGQEEASGESRAGHPSEVAPWAVPSDTGKYIGYEVGGGKALHGDGPTLDEGTWGWDYEGCLWPARVVLDWFHGKYQGGPGAYDTDGPRPVEAI